MKVSYETDQEVRLPAGGRAWIKYNRNVVNINSKAEAKRAVLAIVRCFDLDIRLADIINS